MKVFISWSGPRSHDVALLLREWLPRVIQQARPWVSSEDINKGAAWLGEINSELQSTARGIVCVTPGNENAPWLNYEAGALTKEAGQHRVCVALLGVETTDLTGPLRNFQATRLSDEADVLKLVKSLNSDLHQESRLSASLLEHSFEREWETLAAALDQILDTKDATTSSEPRRSDRDLLEETLQLVRGLTRSRDAAPVKESSAVSPVVPAALRDLLMGEEVSHDTFGLGTVTELSGKSLRELVGAVDFGAEGSKRLLLRYAPLTLVETGASVQQLLLDFDLL